MRRGKKACLIALAQPGATCMLTVVAGRVGAEDQPRGVQPCREGQPLHSQARHELSCSAAAGKRSESDL